jgi:N-acetylmuramoyl-L-alanine amidase
MRKILYIDAGHGGLDSNGNYTTPPKTGKYFDHKDNAIFHKRGLFFEGVWNRTFAYKFIEKATAAGFQCVPVFHPHNDTRLGDRVEIANESYKKFGNEGTYLSFHSNASGVPNVRGFNIFFHPMSKNGKEVAIKLVNPIQNLFIKYGSESRYPLREGYMNAEKTQIYYVLEATSMPSVLFEFGFFDNLEDAKLIFQDSFQEELAEVLVQALLSSNLF